MIQSYLTGPVALLTNTEAVAFTTDCVRTRSAYPCGGWLCHSQGSPLYKVTKGGNYRVTFNANVTGATTGDPIALALFRDGVEVPGSRIIEYIGVAGAYYNVSFDKVVPICCGDSGTLTIQSVPSVPTGTTTPGTATTTQPVLIQNANITITKLS